ncbi:MAG: hypothetical protein F6K36_21830 [Symploca sp. SIO3C6]|nr:hypothetical protein [Symploca sp. SIO3C6]
MASNQNNNLKKHIPLIATLLGAIAAVATVIVGQEGVVGVFKDNDSDKTDISVADNSTNRATEKEFTQKQTQIYAPQTSSGNGSIQVQGGDNKIQQNNTNNNMNNGFFNNGQLNNETTNYNAPVNQGSVNNETNCAGSENENYCGSGATFNF